MKKKDTKYKAPYNPDLDCYVTGDGLNICYRVNDPNTKRTVTHVIERGKDGVTEDLIIAIAELNRETSRIDRQNAELRDPLFDAKVNRHIDCPNDGETVNPWNTLFAKNSSPEAVLFAEPEAPENPQAAIVRRVIDEKCTAAQQDFYFKHFGMCMQITEMREAMGDEAPGASAMTNRKNKIIKKISAELGVEPVKRHKYTKKNNDDADGI